MATIQRTVSPGDSLCDPIPETVAAAQKAALDQVLGHLTATGINAQLIRRVAVQCATSPAPSAQSLWYPPQLVIYADKGRQIARISVGPRSGSYLVELVDDRPDRAGRVEVVRGTEAKRVAWLISRAAA
ncbi:hypothetical protein [Nonomuraea sp. NPDC023979]|uniref:hypothetical protein n=1 Tax=Nonomuraea sp. NPDC023979 TaxID=3154796 RepID=UPI0033D649AB